MSERPRLTKKRLAALDAALSLDDLLYEKFRRLSADLALTERRFDNRHRFRVVQETDRPDVHRCLCILRVSARPEGIEIVVAR